MSYVCLSKTLSMKSYINIPAMGKHNLNFLCSNNLMKAPAKL